MNIALCQINTILGNFTYNRSKILKYCNDAKIKNADIVVFPELSISGYPPQDLIFQNEFIKQNLEELDIISKKSTIPLIIGYIRKDGNKTYNSAAVCYSGKIQSFYDKILLPTYDVFDERRYFTSGDRTSLTVISYNGKKLKIGLQICEDMWDSQYTCKVSKEQMEKGAELIINISASPYQKDRLIQRKSIIREKVMQTKLPIFYCNTVGAQDELIFDGQSLAFSNDGKVIGYANAFKEELIIVNSNSKTEINIKKESMEEKTYNALCLGVKDYFIKTGHKEALIGLSGGIDSSLVASIATDALGSKNVHGISLPSKYSSKHSLDDAKLLADNLGIDYKVIPINSIVGEMESILDPYFHKLASDVTEENIQARVRGNILMALSNKFNWLVLSTGNKTELALGYCTLYGDMSGGLSVISDLNKMDVYGLCNWLNTKYDNRIPKNIIIKPPSAELSFNQVDPFDYSIVSPLVELIVEKGISKNKLVKSGVDKDLVDSVHNRIRLNEFKRRQSAPCLRISSKSFGVGRRFPIVNHFQG